MKSPWAFLILFLHLHIIANCQDSLHNLNLRTALKIAEENYPLLKSKRYDADAARKNINLSKNTLVPSLDIAYQANYATANNITGMFYPVDMIPMTGPVFSSSNYRPAFGSAASLLLNWQPLTFGQRNAEVGTSKAEAAVKSADLDNEIFKHKVNVISSYLDLLLTMDLLSVYEKNIERNIFDLKQSRVLSSAGLRPGVDTALFLSELSKAKIDLLNARKNLQSQKINLSKLLVTDSALSISDTSLFDKPPLLSAVTTEITLNQHPIMKLYQSQFDLSKSKENLIRKNWLPKFNVWATTFARGSGVYPDGTIKAADGLGFSKYNYGVGFQLAFPILKFSEVKIREQQQGFISKANEELLNQTSLELSKQDQVSNVTLQNALDIAKETPVQFESADYAFRALQTRYNAGLVNFADLIQAQYSLVKAETDLKKSYWEVWKALLYKSAVAGDLNIILNEIK